MRALALLVAAVAGCSPRAPVGSTVAPAPLEQIDVTLFLVGDAGAPDPEGEPVLQALTAQAQAAPGAVVVFLGDNVYPRGMPDSAAGDRPEAERRLAAQIAAVRGSGARGVFVPGNHDWDRQGRGGWDAIRRQQRAIARHEGDGVALLPADGCPGPAVVDVGRTVRVVALDTQWWLHSGAKPEHPVSTCPADSESEIVDSLRAALATAGARRLVIAAHHPFATGGVHGGHFGWRSHVFPLRAWKRWLWLPLPIIGSAYPVARQLGISNQDLSGPRYRRMREAFARAFTGAPAFVYAAGHEHDLQVISGASARYLLVSGAGVYGHLSDVGWTDSTRYAARASGYMRLEVLRSGRARLSVTLVDRAGRPAEVYSQWLE